MQPSYPKDVPQPDALMQEAVSALLARDLARARELIRRAVTIGHVDAALMEIALVANGSGGPADWMAALRLLQAAAKDDPVAAEQLALVEDMELDEVGMPMQRPTGELLSRAPTVSLFRALLSPPECRHVASVAAAVMEPSLVIDPGGKAIANPVRRCDNGTIGPTREDLVVRAINLRIASASDTHVTEGEPLTVLRYRPGQEYRPHFDALPNVANQRIKTVLVYLNEGFGGGETLFLASGLKVTPRAGDAILFDNIKADGAIDMQSRHAGLPVTHGAKWLATRWIRAKSYNPWAPG